MIAERRSFDVLGILVDRCRDGIDLATAYRMLEIMQAHGQSVTLSWGEDDRQWECSWISGERYTGRHSSLQGAILFAARKAVDGVAY